MVFSALVTASLVAAAVAATGPGDDCALDVRFADGSAGRGTFTVHAYSPDLSNEVARGLGAPPPPLRDCGADAVGAVAAAAAFDRGRIVSMDLNMRGDNYPVHFHYGECALCAVRAVLEALAAQGRVTPVCEFAGTTGRRVAVCTPNATNEYIATVVGRVMSYLDAWGLVRHGAGALTGLWPAPSHHVLVCSTYDARTPLAAISAFASHYAGVLAADAVYLYDTGSGAPASVARAASALTGLPKAARSRVVFVRLPPDVLAPLVESAEREAVAWAACGRAHGARATWALYAQLSERAALPAAAPTLRKFTRLDRFMSVSGIMLRLRGAGGAARPLVRPGRVAFVSVGAACASAPPLVVLPDGTPAGPRLSSCTDPVARGDGGDEGDACPGGACMDVVEVDGGGEAVGRRGEDDGAACVVEAGALPYRNPCERAGPPPPTRRKVN